MSNYVKSLLVVAMTECFIGCSDRGVLNSADHIVVTMSRSSVSLTIGGQDAKSVIQAVRSAKRESREDACIYDIKAVFFNGTERLGEIVTCGDLFYFRNKKYQDETGNLEQLVVAPIRQASSNTNLPQLWPNPSWERTGLSPVAPLNR